MNSIFRTVMLWLALLVVIMTAWHFAQAQKNEQRIAFSELLSWVETGEVDRILIRPSSGGPAAEFLASTERGAVRAHGIVTDNVLAQLRASGVQFTIGAGEDSTSWSSVLISSAPFILLIGFWIFFMRQMKVGNMNTAKNAVVTRLDKEAAPRGTLVGSAAATLPELRTLITGAPHPAAVLITGPSGSGKTRLLRALAAELKRPCLWADGSSFIGMFLGLGTARVQDFMARARKDKAAFAAIDGIDDLCRLRSDETRAERDERSQAMQALLAALDEWRAKPAFAFIGVSNRPDLLDDAVLRRFDRVLALRAPDAAARESLLRELLPGLDASSMAARTEGWMPSDLEAVATDAARRAAGAAISAADTEAALAARAEVRTLVTQARVKIAG